MESTKTLVISDNEVLNQLYSANLEVYLATEVTVVSSIKKAQELYLAGHRFNLAIVMNMINGQDSALLISDWFKRNHFESKLVIIGHPLREIPDATIVQSSFQLQQLIRSCAEILGITAKDMAAFEVEDYFSIKTSFLTKIKETPCPIYMKVKKGNSLINFSMVAKKGTNLKQALSKLFESGIEELFVEKLDRLLIINQVSAAICVFLENTNGMGAQEKSEGVSAGFEFVASSFCQTEEAAHEVMAIAKSCTKVMEEISQDVPNLRTLLKMLSKNNEGYLFFHSMLSSYVATQIIRKIPWGGEGHIEKINFVLFFHDIALAPLFEKFPELRGEEGLLLNPDLSTKEKETVLNHSKIAADLVLSFKRAPIGADLLIKQHHGMSSGIGFATDFKDDVSPLSRVIIVAEAFVEEFLIAKKNNLISNEPFDLNKIIEKLNLKFKRTTYRKIISTLENLSI